MKNKKIIIVESLLFSFLLTSCGDKVPSNLKEVEDNNTINNFKTIYLNYGYFTPGLELSSMILFKGWDEDNLWGPSISKEERYHTYLVDYSNKNDTKYYFIYFKNSNLNKFNEYYKNNVSGECNFVDNQYVIDSKYLHISNKLEMNDYLIYESDSLDNITYSFNNYFLGSVFESRNITIKEDVSENKTLNKEIPLFNKMLFEYNTKSKIVEKYSGNELDDNSYTFNLECKRLEAYSTDYLNQTYLNTPFLGHKNQDLSGARFSINKDDTILLPRYFKNNQGEMIDLLDENYEYQFLEDDIYKDLKKEFKDAFIKLESENSKNGYYSLSKVKEIIYNNRNN